MLNNLHYAVDLQERICKNMTGRQWNIWQNINQIANMSKNRHHPPENEATLDTNKRRFLNFFQMSWALIIYTKIIQENIAKF